MNGEIVVVTGSSGFIGHHVVKLLISHDDRVKEIRCLDLKEPEIQMTKIIEDELEKLKVKTGIIKRIKRIEGDVRDINVAEQVLRDADCVIHCAAKIDIWTENKEQDVAELESVNVGGTENLLKAAVRLGVPKFIHVSSFEVYTAFDTLYYATENTLPDISWHLFGASGSTKKQAEDKVKQYSNNKLSKPSKSGKDSLNAVIIRFTTAYGEFDKYFVTKILESTKYFGGTLRRLTNVWIRQQPIYVVNAAWSLIKAKQQMDVDMSISGEEFHITDDTKIEDPFDFIEPYLECKDMKLTKSSYPFVLFWILIYMLFAAKRLVGALDFLGLFTEKRNRLKEAIEKDRLKQDPSQESREGDKSRHWYHYVTPQTLAYMCSTAFLNRTKASLRLHYDPLVEPEEAKRRSIEWYKNQSIR